jgi:hypothetical protein
MAYYEIHQRTKAVDEIKAKYKKWWKDRKIVALLRTMGDSGLPSKSDLNKREKK